MTGNDTPEHLYNMLKRQIFKYVINSKNKSNFRGIAKIYHSASCLVPGITKNAYVLEGLRSLAIIEINRNNLTDDYNYFSFIFRTYAILLSVQKKIVKCLKLPYEIMKI